MPVDNTNKHTYPMTAIHQAISSFRRRLLVPLAACLAVLLLTGACNGDVFIDDFLPDIPSISLTEEESHATISFEADNWGICNAYYLPNTLSVHSTDLGGNSQDFPFAEGATGIVRFYSDYFDLEIRKESGRELDICLCENLYDDPVEIILTVGNEYEEKAVSFSALPTGKYRVDSVAYDWAQFSTHDYGLEEVATISIDNRQGSDTVWWTVYPFRDIRRKVSFFVPGPAWDETHYTRLLGQPLPTIAIPDVVDGKPVMQDTRVAFGIQEQQLETDLDKDVSHLVPVPGGKHQRIDVFVGIVDYSVPYTVYCSNPENGRTRTFSGTLYSDTPTDQHFITRTDLTDTYEERN